MALTDTPAPADRTERPSAPAPRSAIGKVRLRFAMACFLGVYGVIAGKLVYLGVKGPEHTGSVAIVNQTSPRPDLLDRNGEVLATDIKTSSLFAEPNHILDVDEAVEALASVLPEMRDASVRHKLRSGAKFVWLKREITPEQRFRIHRLGIPGIGFRDENKRFYPGGGMVSHVVGHVNIDNQGIAGIEKYIDDEMGLGDLHKLGMVPDRGLEPRRLSLDLRVQHVVRDELSAAKERYQAVAAVGIVLDVHTGEVIAMSSLPDYDPNDPAQALEKDRMNRATGGVFEMGSVFKTFNSAMALDSGKIGLNDSFDARGGLSFGGARISDFHGKNRVLSVPEIFIYSSNIGSAKMAMRVGAQAQYDFFSKMGFHSKIPMELPENALPLWPKKLSEVSTATQSFGHGISISPMHTAAAAVAVVNGGRFIPPTFFLRTAAEANAVAKQVLRPETSEKMKYLFKLNAERGSGRRADVPGYRVGGKTGTAEKLENGHYSGNKRFNSYLSAFPIDDPKYVVLVVLDEPKPEKEVGAATAALNAAPTVGAIVKRIAPMLNIAPRFDLAPAAFASAN
ncbi:peptidoglycan D,D-transpeptidase FtsI family protein [Prosthecomicrobium sp. N25]|uniref:peptidoglycan D,D-transpeptidase FtsI family protein n=1 Tax=Prosthecomicrobium sp. N25 TaxID=3129254 RepID=UPI00307888CA